MPRPLTTREVADAAEVAPRTLLAWLAARLVTAQKARCLRGAPVRWSEVDRDRVVAFAAIRRASARDRAAARRARPRA